MSKTSQPQQRTIDTPSTGPYPDVGKAPESAAPEPTPPNMQRASTLSAPRPKPVDALRGLLERPAMQEQIARALPKHLTPERMIRMSLTVFQRTPGLQKCDLNSVIACIVQASELGLELSGPLGQAWMVPYKDTATFQVGYKGYLELSFRTGKVSAFPMRVVYDKDFFEIDYGTTQQLVHRPVLRGPRGPVIGYYACCYFKDGSRDFEFMSVEDIQQHLKKYVRNVGPGSPWSTAPDAMALKTCVRMLAKRLPLSTEFRTALAADDFGEHGQPPQYEHLGGTPLLTTRDEDTGYTREREPEYVEETAG